MHCRHCIYCKWRTVSCVHWNRKEMMMQPWQPCAILLKRSIIWKLLYLIFVDVHSLRKDCSERCCISSRAIQTGLWHWMNEQVIYTGELYIYIYTQMLFITIINNFKICSFCYWLMIANVTKLKNILRFLKLKYYTLHITQACSDLTWYIKRL